MDDLRIGTEFTKLSGYPVVKTRPDRDEYIAFMHGHVCFVGPVHTQHPDELRIGRRVRTQTHQGIGNRIAQVFRELGQFLGSVTEHNPATAVDHRTLGFQNNINRFLDLALVPLYYRIVRTH